MPSGLRSSSARIIGGTEAVDEVADDESTVGQTIKVDRADAVDAAPDAEVPGRRYGLRLDIEEAVAAGHAIVDVGIVADRHGAGIAGVGPIAADVDGADGQRAGVGDTIVNFIIYVTELETRRSCRLAPQ